MTATKNRAAALASWRCRLRCRATWAATFEKVGGMPGPPRWAGCRRGAVRLVAAPLFGPDLPLPVERPAERLLRCFVLVGLIVAQTSMTTGRMMGRRPVLDQTNF